MIARKQPRPKPRQSYHHGDLRRALLDAAIATAESYGLHVVTMRNVARSVGVSPNAPYNHFEDLAALLAAVAEEGLGLLYKGMVEARERATTPGAQLEAIGVAYVSFAIERSAYFRLFTAKEIGKKTEHPGLALAYNKTFGVLYETIEMCQREGVVHQGDTRRLALTAWSTVHGLATLIVEDQLDAAGFAGWGDKDEKLASSIVRALFRGLKA